MDLIVRMRFGAHLYGTATGRSDIDYRGVFLPSREEILLGAIPRCLSRTTGDHHSKNTNRDVDEEIYSLHHFIDLACRGEIAAMDMLPCAPGCMDRCIGHLAGDCQRAPSFLFQASGHVPGLRPTPDSKIRHQGVAAARRRRSARTARGKKPEAEIATGLERVAQQ